MMFGRILCKLDQCLIILAEVLFFWHPWASHSGSHDPESLAMTGKARGVQVGRQ
jgi:hypothetical protein